LLGVNYVLYLGLPLVAMALGRIRLGSGLQLRLPPWVALPAVVLVALAAVPLVLTLIDWLVSAGLTFAGPAAEQRSQELVRPWRQLSVVSVAAVFALIGVGEEVLFRGLLFSALRATTGQRTTIIGSAVLFGICHAVINVDQLLPATLMGLLLGWVCWQTRSIWPGMLLHATYNATLIALVNYQTGPPRPPGMWRMDRTARVVNQIPEWWQWSAIPVALVALGLIWWFRRPEPRLPAVVEAVELEPVVALDEAIRSRA
jgi:membrane protease YdiL (CAAX protease family)